MFKYEYLPTIEDVHQAIVKCEGVHPQQVAFSTFHDALTQICFGCRCIRSGIIVSENFTPKVVSKTKPGKNR